MADKDGGPAEAFATPEKEAVSLAQEGWSETTPGGTAGAPKDGEENLDAKLVMAAQAARLSETGALGFVGVEGMNSVIEAVRKHFSSLASQGSARPEEGSDAQTLAAQDAGKLAKLLRDDETVRPLLKEPARMRESDGKYDTLDAVLDDVASFGAGDSSAGNKKVLEVEDVYNLFGLGGPDLDPYQSTSTFLTVEDSEMREKIIEEHLCLESLGEEAQLVYFGGLGKSHLGSKLQGEWQSILADGDSGAGARGRVEKEMGSECIRNDLYVLSANDLMGSRPTINGTSLSTVNHSVGILEVAVPLSEVSEDLGDCAYLDACAGRVEHNLDLSHLRMMQPTGFGSRGSNLSSAQALAAVNACLALDPQAEGNTIGRTTLEVILGKFLPNTERERILDEAGDDSGRCDAAAVRAAILKSAEVLQLLQERREANLDHFSLNDLRELRVSVEEICWNRETKPGKIWIETGLRDAEQDLNSVSSSVKLSGERGTHKCEGMDLVFDLCEPSGSVLRSCRKVVEGECRPCLLLKVLSKEGELGRCELGLCSGTEQRKEWADIVPPGGGAPIGKLGARVFANAALLGARTFDADAVPSYELLIYGGLQRSKKAKQLVPSNRLQVYKAATNDLGKVDCIGEEPEPTSCHAACQLGEILIVQGGLASKGRVKGGCHYLHAPSTTWHAVEADEALDPGQRFDHTCCPSPDPEALITDLVFFGGEQPGGQLTNSVSCLEVSSIIPLSPTQGDRESLPCRWARCTVSGAIPKPRAGHAACSAVGEGGERRLWVFGGRVASDEGQTELCADLLCATLERTSDGRVQVTWEDVEVEGGGPGPRERCSLHEVGGRLLLSHGWTGEGKTPWTSDLWLFDQRGGKKGSWRRIALENAARFPTPRHGLGSALRRLAPGPRTAGEGCKLYDCGGAGPSRCGDEAIEVCAGEERRFVFKGQARAYVAMVTRQDDGSVCSYPTVARAAHDHTAYSFSFRSVRSGTYRVEVFSRMSKDPECCASIVVAPGPPSPGCFVVSGPAAVGCVAGEPSALSVALHDAYGNALDEVSDSDLGKLKVLVKFKREMSAEVKTERDANARNVVRVTFSLQERGTHGLHVFYEGQLATSMDVKCLAGGVCLENCVLDPRSSSQSTWHSGVEYKFSVVLRDKGGLKVRAQDVPGSENLLKAFAEEKADVPKKAKKAANGSNAITDCASFANKDGTLGFSFTPTRSGECVVNVHYYASEYKPVAVQGCPFVVKVASSEIEAKKSKVVTPVPGRVVAGETHPILVQAKDKFGNSVSTSHEEVECRVLALPSRRVAKRIKAVNKEDGTYEVGLQLEDASQYELHFEMLKEGKFQAVSGSPRETTCAAGKLSPRHCTAFGRGVSGTTPAGEQTEFLVVSRDAYGNRIREGGAAVDVSVQSGSRVPCSVTDNGDGTYTCSYVPGTEESFTGRTVYAVAVKVAGRELEESPFFQRVYPPQTCAYNTSAASVPKRMNSGESVEFFVQARDAENRNCVHGMDPFTLDIELEEKQGKGGGEGGAKAPLTGEIKDMHDGRYLVRLFAEENLYAIARVGILLGTPADPVQEHIKDSPFQLMVTPKGLFGMGLWGAKKSASAAAVDESLASAFVLSGRGLRECVAGEETEFDLTPVQGDSLALGKSISASQIDSSLFKVELRGPQYIEGRVEGPDKDGNFRARYRPYLAGAYVLMVKIGRFALQQCPFSVRCSPDVTCAETCEISDFGLMNKRAGDDLVLQVTTLDAQRNKNYSDDERFHVICRGGSIQGKGKMAKFQKNLVEADSRPRGDGVHEVRFAVPIEGAYSVIVMHRDAKTGSLEELEASPVPFVVEKSLKKEQEQSAPNAAAISMTNLTHKALVASGSAGERKPNFLERRLKKILGEKDVQPEDHILRKEEPKPMFSAGLWRKPDYWETMGIYTIGTPPRRVQHNVMDLHKKGLRRE